MQYTNEELAEILRKHKLWLDDEEGGERAFLQGADLRWACLQEADLREACLRGADLREACLQEADLRWACLQEAFLQGAFLQEAFLRGADLREACLQEADLRGACLRGACLRGADLREACLQEACLRGADLREACLQEADLREACLRGADLREACLQEADLRWACLQEAFLQEADLRDIHVSIGTYGFALACPEFGSFIGWKKAKGKIVKLLIPEDAKRSSATGRKCRCSKATVIAIENLDGAKSACDSVASDHSSSFIYKVGETVEVPDFCENRWQECAPGIHFFITRQEAVLY